MSETNGTSASGQTFIHARLPVETAVLLESWCKRHDRSKNYAVRTIVHDWLIAEHQRDLADLAASSHDDARTRSA